MAIVHAVKPQDRYGFLTVISESYAVKDNKNKSWRTVDCLCDCGKTISRRVNNLTHSKMPSCGCKAIEQTVARSTKHGHSRRNKRTRINRIWLNMITRCYNPNSLSYKDYGGRGIKVCDRWRTFANFLEDMEPTYRDDLTIDRIDNDKGYSPDNCRWATHKEQMQNQSKTKFATYQGRTLCISEWEKELGFPRSTIQGRLRIGWSIEKALTTPVNPNPRKVKN